MKIRLRSSAAALAIVTSLVGAARADAPAPQAAWQSRCAAAIRAAKGTMIARELITETPVEIGTFSLPMGEGSAPMVRLQYFVSHGLAVTIYVWQVERAAKATGWRDIDELHDPRGMREARERGRLHAEILAGNTEPGQLEQFRAILRKAGDACLK